MRNAFAIMVGATIAAIAFFAAKAFEKGLVATLIVPVPHVTSPGWSDSAPGAANRFYVFAIVRADLATVAHASVRNYSGVVASSPL